MCDLAFGHSISHTESNFTAFTMKPFVENTDTSCANFSDGDEEGSLPWSLSITNVPNDVYEDEKTKVSQLSYKSLSLPSSLLDAAVSRYAEVGTF